MKRGRNARRSAGAGRRCWCGRRAAGDWSGWLDGPGMRATLHLGVCAGHRWIGLWRAPVRLDIEAAIMASRAPGEAAVLCEDFHWYS